MRYLNENAFEDAYEAEQDYLFSCAFDDRFHVYKPEHFPVEDQPNPYKKIIRVGLYADTNIFLYDYFFNQLDDTFEQALVVFKESGGCIKQPVRSHNVFGFLAGKLRSFIYKIGKPEFIIFQPKDVKPINQGSLDFSVSSYNVLRKEHLTSSPKWRGSVDVPECRSFIDMGINDQTLLGAKSQLMASDIQYRFIPVGDQMIRIRENAGGLDRACFAELCSVYNNSVYRLELLTGAEVPKQENITWLKNHIGKNGIDDLTASDFADCFKKLNLGMSEFYKLIFGGVASYKIDQSGNGHEYDFYFLKTKNCLSGGLIKCSDKAVLVSLKKLQVLAEEMALFELESNQDDDYQDDNFSDGDEDDQTDFEVDSLEDFEDLPVNSGWTAKQLSNNYEALPHHIIAKITNCNYQTYLNFNKQLKDKGDYCLSSKLSPSALSQVWVYMNLRKQYFYDKKQYEISQVAKKLSGFTYDSIKEYKRNPNKQNKKRITVQIYGGVWGDEEVKKVDKVTADLLWSVLSGKM